MMCEPKAGKVHLTLSLFKIPEFDSSTCSTCNNKGLGWIECDWLHCTSMPWQALHSAIEKNPIFFINCETIRDNLTFSSIGYVTWARVHHIQLCYYITWAMKAETSASSPHWYQNLGWGFILLQTTSELDGSSNTPYNWPKTMLETSVFVVRSLKAFVCFLLDAAHHLFFAR